jgi:hypothetical protein
MTRLIDVQRVRADEHGWQCDTLVRDVLWWISGA